MKSYTRFLSRNKAYALISFIGLSVALAFVVLLYSYVRGEMSVGRNGPRAKETYFVGSGDYLGMTRSTAEKLFPDIPEITKWSRYFAEGEKEVKASQNWFEANTAGVDTDFFRMAGVEADCASALTSKDNAILSESFARKAFGTENPVGRVISIGKKNYNVCGTVRDFGPEDVFKPVDVFLSSAAVEENYPPMDQFGPVNILVNLAPGASAQKVKDKLLDAYLKYWPEFFQRENDGNVFLWGSSLTRMDQLYFSDLDGAFRRGDRSKVRMMGIIALVLLLCALLNYINLTVALTGKRAKEMATRRLLGETKRGITWRYLSEAALFSSVSIVVGILFAILLRNQLSTMLGTDLVLWGGWQDLSVLFCIFVVLTLVCGLIPAVFVSKFSPIDIVKGDFRLKNKMVFSKVFIVLQNVVCAVFLALGMTMSAQMSYLKNYPVGYNTDNLMFVQTWNFASDIDKVQHVADVLKALPEVEGTALMGSWPTMTGMNGVHEVGDDDKKLSYARVLRADSTAFRLLGFEVLERWSDPLAGTVWVTEEACRRYHLDKEHPLLGDPNKNSSYTACGVVRDYLGTDLMQDTEGDDAHNMVGNLKAGENSGWIGCVLVKTSGDTKAALAAVNAATAKLSEEFGGAPLPMVVKTSDELLSETQTDSRNMMKLTLIFLGIAILISIFGMVGMSMYYIGQQRHSLAVSKVFGADNQQTAWKIAGRFIYMSAAAALIAIPISIVLMRRYLQDFPLHIDFPWWTVVVATILTLLIAFVSVALQTRHAAKENPVDGLRQEF